MPRDNVAELSLRRLYPPLQDDEDQEGCGVALKGGPTGVNPEPCTLQHSARGCVHDGVMLPSPDTSQHR